MTPSFRVDAAYFYALTANLPIQVSADVRYRLAVTTDASSIVDTLQGALDAGVLAAADVTITPDQAARRLSALGDADGTGPTVNAASVGTALVTAWLGPVDVTTFWNGVLGSPTEAAAHLALVICALIQAGDPTKLLGALAAEGITVTSVKDLDPTAYGGSGGITYAQWLQTFSDHPEAVPAFAKVGTKPITAATPPAERAKILNEQTSAFVRRFAQFFDVPAITPGAPVPLPGSLPQLDTPQPDAISAFAAAYVAQGHPGFAFGQSDPLDANAASQAAAAVFPGDARAQAWLVEAASAVNALHYVTHLGGVSPMLRFSLTEALYARGFTSTTSIAALTADDLQDALIGTPAYPFAQQIQKRALGASPPVQPAAPPGGSFGPINDGTLANCVPPPWLSPLGPVAYLRDLWLLSESATCEAPDGDGSAPTLGAAVSGRRGPLGDQLLATKANLERALPRIDLVNECLETVVAHGTVDVVYQTSGGVEDAVRLRAAVPEHSSPGPAIAAAYAKLGSDFTAPVLPYAQPLDVCRSYLHELRTSRFAAMHRFRKDVAELVLDPDPAHLPADFATYRLRYPVRMEIARELLGVSPEEQAQLFTGPIGPGLLAELYGFPPSASPSWMQTVTKLSELLARTGLTYCEMAALQRSGFVAFQAGAQGQVGGMGDLPACEPCYLDKYLVVFAGSPEPALARIAVLARLWRKLQHVPGARYTFDALADIATVLRLFPTAGSTATGPDFLRQLAAFQMLRDDLDLPLVDAHDTTPGTGADRTHLLALFAMPPSLAPAPRKWEWAVETLVDRIRHHARTHHHGEPRPSELVKLLTDNLDPLSRLAGFDPSDPERRWHAEPTHALRFAEVLSKLMASHFSVGEILYLFTVGDALDGDDPFPLPSAEEARDMPLDLPDDASERALSALRRKLLEVDVSDEDARAWTWTRIERSLRGELGFQAAPGGADPVLALGRHFFPRIVERAGTTADARDRQYRFPLGSTTAEMWNAPSDGPLHYDAGAHPQGELWAEIPLADEAVLEKLSRVRPLMGSEKEAVRALYFMPRIDLAPFAFLFPTFEEADRRLIQDPDEEGRWAYFQRSFARAHARCRIIARHLAEHVAAATGGEMHEGHDEALAWRLLRHLLADENEPKAGSWESPDGKPPATLWSRPSGGAFAALLGLAGTGSSASSGSTLRALCCGARCAAQWTPSGACATAGTPPFRRSCPRSRRPCPRPRRALPACATASRSRTRMATRSGARRGTR
jgi:hypothetical protein